MARGRMRRGPGAPVKSKRFQGYDEEAVTVSWSL